jgi:signal transduction histidine kinase
MSAIDLGVAVPNQAPRGTSDASALRSTAPAVAGLVMLVVALLLWGTHKIPGTWGAIVPAVLVIAGLALFLFSLSARVGAGRAELVRAKERLQRDLAAAEERIHGLESGKRQVDAMLAATPARLLVLDRDLNVRTSYSNELDALFGAERREQRTFLDLLRGKVSPDVLEAVRGHVDALFDPADDAEALEGVNPLRSIEIAAPQPDGSLLIRFVRFGFRRIYENGAIAGVLVAADDVTEFVDAEQRLREAERFAQKNFDTLLGILNLDSRALDEFVRTAQGELGAIDRSLGSGDVTARGGGDAGLLRQRLAGIAERVGAIREGAALLRFEHFERRAAEYQETLALMRTRPSLSGEDYLRIVNEQAAFRAELEDMQTLRVRLTALRRAAQIQDDAGDDMLTGLGASARELAADLGKEVVLDVDGFDSRGLTPERRLLVKDVLGELLRNAVVHGIEEATERESAGKPRAGTIEIRPLRDALAGSFAFCVRDDGRGIDPSNIRERAVALGMLEAPKAEAMSDSEAAGYIFVPGFTTADVVRGEKVRGVGLNTVKNRVVDECGGTISIDSESGSFCEFSFVLPAQRVSFRRNG